MAEERIEHRVNGAPEPLARSVVGIRARALALMFASGPTLALLALALPGDEGVDRLPWALNASLGYPVAAVLWWWGRRLPEAALHGALVAGATIVALGITFGNGGSLSVGAAFFYIWVSLYVYLFFEWRIASAHVVLDAALMSVAFAVSGVDAAAAVAVLIVGTSAVVGVVTGMTRAELARLAVIDHLTGLPNRRHLHSTLLAEAARSTRTSVPFSVVVLDLDGLKEVNDTDGHHAGDQLLVGAARAWRQCLRPTDVLVRYGGDEFVAVLPSCGPSDALEIADRLCEAVDARCSIGLATRQPGEGHEDVLRRADQNLYRSKRNGGGQITAEDPPQASASASA